MMAEATTFFFSAASLVFPLGMNNQLIMQQERVMAPVNSS
jgi:hypothetical protein